MLPPEDVVRLRHMLDHARKAIAMAVDHNRDSFARDRRNELAVVRLMEIIGEAANRVSLDQEVIHNIPWPQIIGLRNRLIHGYDAVD